MKQVFVSVGAAANAEQEAFVAAVRDRIRSAGLEPKTVGDGFWDNSAPLRGAERLLNQCHGAMIVALERYRFAEGVENPGEGGRDEARVADVRVSTVWNQIEGAMAYSRRLPIMVVVHRELLRDGILQDGYDWYVLKVGEGLGSLSTPEFNGVFESWRRQVDAFRTLAESETEAEAVAETGAAPPDVEKMSVGALLGLLRPGQLWSLLSLLGAVIAGAFALGAKLG